MVVTVGRVPERNWSLTSNRLASSHLPSSVGRVPLKELAPIARYRDIAVIEPNSVGNEPVIKFEQRKPVDSEIPLETRVMSPSSVGTVDESEFRPNEKEVTDVSCPNSLGIAPLSELSSNTNIRSSVSAPNCVGIFRGGSGRVVRRVGVWICRREAEQGTRRLRCFAEESARETLAMRRVVYIGPARDRGLPTHQHRAHTYRPRVALSAEAD